MRRSRRRKGVPCSAVEGAPVLFDVRARRLTGFESRKLPDATRNDQLARHADTRWAALAHKRLSAGAATMNRPTSNTSATGLAGQRTNSGLRVVGLGGGRDAIWFRDSFGVSTPLES